MSSLTVPKSSVVLIGDRVEMNCNVNGNKTTKWTYTSWNTSTDTDIYLGIDIIPSMRSRYRINKTISGQHNLIIDSVDFTYAGRYRCTTAVQEMPWNDIQLTVLGSRPACAANISEEHVDGSEGARLQLSGWCSINYIGNGFPVFTWTKSNAEKNIVANTTTSGTSRGPFTNTSSIMQELYANDSGVTFQCRITFQMPNNSEEDVTNIYEYIWNHTLYGPRNISIVKYDDRLECTAEGNPTPTFIWIHVGTNRSTNESVLLLNDTATPAKDQIFQCTATNVFASETNNFTATKASVQLNGTVTSYKDHTFQCTAATIFDTENKNMTIQGHATNSNVTTGISNFPIMPTASAIGGSLLFILTIAIIVLCIVRRKRREDDKSDRPDVALNADLKSYDDIALSSDRSRSNILDGDNLPGSSDGRTIVDNAVYAEVWKPKGPSKGNKGANIGVNSRPPQTQKPERQIVTGADGTVYAELSGVKPPIRKGEVPKVSKSPAFSQVEIYAAIDHSGKVPAPPLPQK